MSIKYQSFSKELITELKKVYDQHLSDKEKLLAIQAEKQLFQLEKDKGLWMKTSEVHELYSSGIKVIVQWLTTFPDRLELECGLDVITLQLIENIVDDKRNELYEILKTLKIDKDESEMLD